MKWFFRTLKIDLAKAGGEWVDVCYWPLADMA